MHTGWNPCTVSAVLTGIETASRTVSHTCVDDGTRCIIVVTIILTWQVNSRLQEARLPCKPVALPACPRMACALNTTL